MEIKKIPRIENVNNFNHSEFVKNLENKRIRMFLKCGEFKKFGKFTKFDNFLKFSKFGKFEKF